MSNAAAWRKLRLPVDSELLLSAEQRLEDLAAAATKRVIDEISMMYTTGFRIQVHFNSRTMSDLTSLIMALILTES